MANYNDQNKITKSPLSLLNAQDATSSIKSYC